MFAGMNMFCKTNIIGTVQSNFPSSPPHTHNDTLNFQQQKYFVPKKTSCGKNCVNVGFVGKAGPN